MDYKIVEGPGEASQLFQHMSGLTLQGQGFVQRGQNSDIFLVLGPMTESKALLGA